MQFENDISAAPSRWTIIRDHLPILLLGGGAIAVFLGLHMAATGVVVVAALHLLIGAVVFAMQRFRPSRSASTDGQPR